MSLSQWWSTVSIYADQTNSNVIRSFSIAREHSDPALSRGAPHPPPSSRSSPTSSPPSPYLSTTEVGDAETGLGTVVEVISDAELLFEHFFVWVRQNTRAFS